MKTNIEVKKMEEKNGYELDNIRKLEVVQEKIIGKDQDGYNVYMVVWERIANAGIIYVYARSENEAYDMVGFSPKYVKHTIAKLDRKNMPVCVGQAN